MTAVAADIEKRARAHRLWFELGGAGLVLLWSRQVALVLVAGAILLPATRATWIGWVRRSLGIADRR